MATTPTPTKRPGNPIRATIRLVALLIAALLWLIIAPPLILLAGLGGEVNRFRMSMRLTHYFCASMGWLMGLRFRVEGARDPDALVFVGNHVSWLDILTSGWGVHAVFVSRHDLETWPLIGIFARLAGTVFINRESLRSAVLSSAAIVTRTAQTIPVVFFPEGRAHDGSEVFPFKVFLFNAIAEKQVRVQPFTLRYTHANSVPITPENRDLVFWHLPEQDFISHIWGVLRLSSVHATLHFREAETAPPDIDRATLTTYVETLRERVNEGIPTWGVSNDK